MVISHADSEELPLSEPEVSGESSNRYEGLCLIRTLCSYSAALMRLSDEDLKLKQMSLRLRRAETEWRNTIEQEHATTSTAEMQRKKESLVRKAKEYKKELDGIMVHVEDPPVTITQLSAQHERIKKQEADIKAKRAKLRAFKGLPPNLDVARMQLKQARDEQMELIKLRERILGKMAAGVS
ncbi:hypothetical protein HWV62_44201 [Athelia sp. TMB]|nr:hypothetical protein HWV62_44201 [Athelia sp. TMB]